MDALPPPPDSRHGLPNLMASLARALDGPDLPAPPLEALDGLLGGRRTLILLVLDGLGDAQLQRHLPGGLLARSRLLGLESVFPSTTASAVGTLLTGLAPVSHGLTGWHVWAEEIGELLAVLPLSRRGGPPTQALERETWASQLLAAPDLPIPLALARRLRTTHGDLGVTHVAPNNIVFSPFNRQLALGAKKRGYDTLPQLFAQLDASLEESRAHAREFIYAYWPDYDSLAHLHGPDSPQAVAALQAAERELAAFAARLPADALLLVTADHGFIHAPRERLLCLNDHPDLYRLLLRPLSGERRAAYVHLKPGQADNFARLARERLGHALWVESSQDLLAAGWFGPGPVHPRLKSRIGDLTLILKDDWTLKDKLPGETEHVMLGMHGGVSPAERQIPLCLPGRD